MAHLLQLEKTSCPPFLLVALTAVALSDTIFLKKIMSSSRQHQWGGLTEVILEVSLDAECNLKSDLLNQNPALLMVPQRGLPQPDVHLWVEPQVSTGLYL